MAIQTACDRPALVCVLGAAIAAVPFDGSALARSGPLSASDAPYALQMPGDFHGDEPVARHGQRWLVLRISADGSARLDASRLRVLKVEDPLVDGPGETTGRRVEADGPEALAFVRGPLLRAGPVDTALVEALGGAGLSDTRIVFAGADYTLRTECAAFAATGEASPSAHSPQCRILLQRGEARVLLMTATGTRLPDGATVIGDEVSPHLLFAGDLDRDGALDLIFDTTDHYNLQRPTLFLSRPAAGQGDAAGGDALPLRAVAQYAAVGC